MSALEKWAAAEAPARFKDVAGRQQGSPFAEFDYLDRKLPRRLGMPDYLLWVCRLDPARVRRVPAAAIAEEGDDELGAFSLIECPCGARPAARTRLEKCPGCERYYVHVELGAVYIAYGAMTPPPLGRRSPQREPPPTTDASASGAGVQSPQPVGIQGDEQSTTVADS